MTKINLYLTKINFSMHKKRYIWQRKRKKCLYKAIRARFEESFSFTLPSTCHVRTMLGI